MYALLAKYEKHGLDADTGFDAVPIDCAAATVYNAHIIRFGTKECECQIETSGLSLGAHLHFRLYLAVGGLSRRLSGRASLL
jgi:hypothetical protein